MPLVFTGIYGIYGKYGIYKIQWTVIKYKCFKQHTFIILKSVLLSWFRLSTGLALVITIYLLYLNK